MRDFDSEFRRNNFEFYSGDRSCHPLVGEVPRHRCLEKSKNNFQPPRVTSSLIRTCGGHPASYPSQKGRGNGFFTSTAVNGRPMYSRSAAPSVSIPRRITSWIRFACHGHDAKMIEVLHSSCSQAARIMHSSVVKDFGSPVSRSVAYRSQGEEDFTVLKSPCEQILL
jgi:hypothetical protein